MQRHVVRLLTSTAIGALLAGLLPSLPAVAQDVTISVGDASVTEGSTGGFDTTLAFDVTLSAVHGTPVTVDYTTQDVTAVAAPGSDVGEPDYIPRSGTLTFQAGETHKTVSLFVNADLVDERREAVDLVLSNPSGATLLDAQGRGRITDDDAVPSLVVNGPDSSVSETKTAGLASTAVFTVQLDAPSARTISVDYATMTDTASEDDFVPVSGSFVFDPGETSKTVPVEITDDTEEEDSETFSLVLTNPNDNATISTASATAVIADDETPALPTVLIHPQDVEIDVREDAGTATVRARLSTLSNEDVSVDYVVSGETATAGEDFEAASGSITIPAGSRSQSIVVSLLDDAEFEARETLVVILSNPVGATFAEDDQGNPAENTSTVTIQDVEPGPDLYVDDVSVDEGSNPLMPPTASFVIWLPVEASSDVTVQYATVDGSASGSDVPGSGDYVIASGEATIAQGTQTTTVDVDINPDSQAEPDEAFFLRLSSPQNASIADAEAVGTIVDDDGAAPTLSIDDVTVAEGDGSATFTVTLSAAPGSGQTVSVDYRTANGDGADPARAGSDYTTTSGTLTFDLNETEQTLTVDVTDDGVDEPDAEGFRVLLSNPVNAEISDGRGDGTITDNDGPPAITVNEPFVTEPDDGGRTDLNFTVSLTAASLDDVTLTYTVEDGTATAGTDYVAVSGGITIPSGETSATIAVPVLGDGIYEGDQTVMLRLASPTNATLGDDTGEGTIGENDPEPSASIVPPTRNPLELDGSTHLAVSLDRRAEGDVTVDWVTVDGTAKAYSDYTADGGTLTFEGGNTGAPINVAILDDSIDETTEQFAVRLLGSSNATIDQKEATVTIIDDDGDPTLTINDVTVGEGDEGATVATFTVTLSPAADGDVTVDYATADATAEAPDDYEAASGTVTIPAGETSGTIMVDVLGDIEDENDETFEVVLSNASGAPIEDDTGVGTIRDDDGSASLSIDDVSMLEGDSGTTDMIFTVSRSGNTSTEVTVDFATQDVTATAPSDYGSQSGTLTFASGDVRELVIVTVNGDADIEDDESFQVLLSDASGAQISDGTGVGTIWDDDAPASLRIDDVTIKEGDTGTRDAVFTVTRSGDPEPTVTVDYKTVEGSATADVDFTSRTGTLTFAADVRTRTISVPVIGDEMDEDDETFSVALSNAEGATITDGTATGIITDDDGTATPKARGIDDSCPSGDVPEDGADDVSDTNGHEYAVDCVQWWEISRGATANSYEPKQPVTRAQMATFIANLIDATDATLPSNPPDHFDDDDSNIHEPNINRLAEAGIVSGFAGRTYGPNQLVNRAQMATFLKNAYEYVTEQTLSSSNDYFTDDDGTTHEASINAIASVGVTTGTSETQYSPGLSVLRDQMASFISRLLDLLVEEGYATPPQN